MKAARYWHTLRHLKPGQFYWRIWFRLYRPRLAARGKNWSLRLPQGAWQVPAGRPTCMLGPQQFRFLNHTHTLPAQGGWNDASQEKLWLYNLHYFDDLNAADAATRVAWHRALLERWLRENPPTQGNGWEPYPTSLRLVNWVKWLQTGNPPVPGMVESLATQAQWLSKKLERHLLGNHLFVNAKALVFAGVVFDGPQAADWLATGLHIIARELPEQVLADGGNFERSPMYHAIFLEDVLDLINAATHWPDRVPSATLAQWRATAASMLAWLSGMTHPDGEIALFNDAAFGIAPNLAALRAYAQRLGVNAALPAPMHFADSGYIRLESDKAVAFLDVAMVGPDYLPGHAHADTLSFELSVLGQRVVVNGGTSRYGLGPDRLRERGTAAHSTVQVAGEDSSEVWGGFRVARRARPFDLVMQTTAGGAVVACSHDGYRRLVGKPVHRREWQMDAGGLLVTDWVSGGNHAAVARFILHPQAVATPQGDGGWRVAMPGAQSLSVMVNHGTAELEPAHYAPEFGRVLPTQCLVVDLVGGKAITAFRWG
jgi:uncharacterized heparinase superfamily protein